MKSILSLVLLVFSTVLFSQKCAIGLKGGAVFANQETLFDGGKNSLPNSYRTGIYTGINGEFWQTENFSFLADFAYLRKGKQEQVGLATESNPASEETVTVGSRLDFLSFAPALKYRFPLRNFAPFVFAGPRLDYYLGYSSSHSFKLFADEFAKDFVVGYNLGAGAEYSFDAFLIFISVEYQGDITKIVDRKPSATNVAVEVRNRAFIPTAGFRIFL